MRRFVAPLFIMTIFAVALSGCVPLLPHITYNPPPTASPTAPPKEMPESTDEASTSAAICADDAQIKPDGYEGTIGSVGGVYPDCVEDQGVQYVYAEIDATDDQIYRYMELQGIDPSELICDEYGHVLPMYTSEVVPVIGDSLYDEVITESSLAGVDENHVFWALGSYDPHGNVTCTSDGQSA